jgi:hypothetical protein
MGFLSQKSDWVPGWRTDVSFRHSIQTVLVTHLFSYKITIGG